MKQTGGSAESYLLYEILKKIKVLTQTIANSGGGGGGSFIPLTGTNFGSPVTGEIQVNPYYQYGSIYATDGSNIGALLLANKEATLSFNDGYTANAVRVGDDSVQAYFKQGEYNSNFLMTFGQAGFQTQGPEGLSYFTAFENYFIVDSDALNSRGITSSFDYTANITDLDFTQKKYVDSLKPYKIYRALLTQTGTNPPEASILENTIGNVTFEYTAVGLYTALLPIEFPLNKATVEIGKGPGPGQDFNNPAHLMVFFNSISTLYDRVEILTGPSPGIGADDILQPAGPVFLEIRIYN